ncbi:MAG: hypothetical protein FWF63_00475 [Fibromonadales bacterium]|nr:hypothetical protein [Fibromonadales bacterium]
MTNYKEIIQLPTSTENDFTENSVLPLQHESGTQSSRKIKLKNFAELIGRLLEFLPNKTSNKTKSIGVQNDAMIAVIGSSSLDMSESASIKMSGDSVIDLGSGVNLRSKGAGAISGLQGTIKDASSLSVFCRVYKVKGYFEAEAKDSDIYNSFSLGDVFYFIADPASVGSATLSYHKASGEEELLFIDQNTSITLILVEKRNTQLRFQKISDTSLEKKIINTLLEHVNNEVIHITQEERESWKNKADQSALADEVKAREEADAELQEEVKALQPTGTNKQTMLGDGTPTPLSAKRDAASSLFANSSVQDRNPFYIYCEDEEGRSNRIRYGKFLSLIARDLVIEGLVPRPPDVTEINSVSLSITEPENGTELNNEARINDNDPNYSVSSISWDPFGIANGTQTYTASVSLMANTIGEIFEFAEEVEVFVNGASPTSIVRDHSRNLDITVEFPRTMTALPVPSLSIPEPAFGAARLTEAVQEDGGNANYSNSIEWTPSGATFPAGESRGEFSLIAEPEHRWNEAQALLNSIAQENVQLSPDGRRLNFSKTVSLSAPPPPPPPSLQYNITFQTFFGKGAYQFIPPPAFYNVLSDGRVALQTNPIAWHSGRGRYYGFIGWSLVSGSWQLTNTLTENPTSARILSNVTIGVHYGE